MNRLNFKLQMSNVKQIPILLIKMYQHTFGLLFPRVCRFTPSCSNYAIEAIQVHGVFIGGMLTMWRILRCNPFFPGGWDPVSPKDFAMEGFFKDKTFHKEGKNE